MDRGKEAAGIESPETIEAALLEVLAAQLEAAREAPAAWHPADDAERLRRMLARGKERLPARLIVEAFALLKRVGTATCCITVHASRAILDNGELTSMLGATLGACTTTAAEDDGGAVAALAAYSSGLAAVEPSGAWLEPMTAGNGDALQVVAALPSTGGGTTPRLLIVGRLVPRPTGQDETLIASRGGLPRAFAPGPLWEIAGPDWNLTALPGFLAAEAMPLVGLRRGNDSLALRVLGRYPSPFEVD